MLTQFELTARQRAAVDHRGGNVLVDAAPGSGKTRVIVARCAALLAQGVSPRAILVLTFSRKSVDELAARLRKEIGDATRLEVRTFHGFAARLLAGTGDAGRSRRLLKEPAERALFEHVVTSTDLRSLPPGVAGSRVFREAAATRVAELRRAPDAAIAILRDRATPRLADLLALASAQNDLRERLGVADFDELIARAVRLGGTPGHAVAEALETRYEHVLVDEFQDTDPLQLALLARFHAEIFAVGDDAQAIYGFRGAARDAMARARDRLDMDRLVLDESFRCPRSICEVARSAWPGGTKLTSQIEHDEIGYRRAATVHDEAVLIADEIAEALAAGVAAHEIAVLLRGAEPMATLLRSELGKRGIPMSRQGGERLIDDLAVDAIVAALRALRTPEDPTVWTRLFAHPAFALDRLALRFALHDTPVRDVRDACALLERLDTPSTHAGARIAAALRSAHEHWERNEPVRAARAFAADSDLLAFVIDGDEDEARSSAARLLAFIDGIGDVRDVRAKLGLDITSTAVFDAFVANGDSWRVEGSSGTSAIGVSILTIHAAKGLEFRFVIVADAADGHLPQTWRADALLGSNEIALARECGVDLGISTDEHANEERSLWYVAVTRSSRRLLVTWSETDSVGSPLRPSRFVPLAARTVESARAAFRGRLDYDLAPALPDLEPPAPAAIVRPIRTSAIETWFSCRRKFYYGALLKIGGDARHFRAKLGTLVHAAIAAFHASVRDFRGAEAGSHERWAATLRELAYAIIGSADFDAFDSPLETEAALRSAYRLLNRYARNLEATATNAPFEVVATEQSVSYEAGGLAFSGRIDRIDRREDGSLVLVDVKTGRIKEKGKMHESFPKLAEAVAKQTLWEKATPNANPQLALYRRAQADTSTLSYLYLGADPKFGTFADVATDDRLELASNGDAIEAIEAALAEAFFKPWTGGSMSTVEPTRVARTCSMCEFETVCPGFLEDDS